MPMNPIITAGLLVAAAIEPNKYGKVALYVLALLSVMAPVRL